MSKRIKRIIKNMSLADKARELTQLYASFILKSSKGAVTGVMLEDEVSKEDIFGIGTILNFSGAKEAIETQDEFIKNSKRREPLITMLDVIHGYRTTFPIPLALAGSFDLELIEKSAYIAGIESTCSGVDLTFSPMVDLCRDARWGRCYESAGEDPYLSGEVGKAFIRGYKKAGLCTCVKHFACYGGAESGREYNTVDVSEHNLYEYYLKPYKECLKENPESVMTSFNAINGIPASGNKKLLIDILRKEWGFDGLVISDHSAIKQMTNHGYCEDEKECAKASLNCEVDIEMMSLTYLKYLPELVKEKKVSIKTVDKMVERVLTLKEKLGLFDNPYYKADEKKSKEVCLCDEHREIAKEVATKTAVLLKNDKNALPLKKNEDVCLIGPFADNNDILGTWCTEGRKEEVITVKAGLESFLKREIPYALGTDTDIRKENPTDIKNAVKVAKGKKTAIICIGEPPSYSGESGSRVDISISNSQVELVKEIKKQVEKVVLVVFAGRPQVLTKVEPFADAILYTYFAGTETGNAVADLLYGKANPSAKLTMSFPRHTGQCPIYYNHFSTGSPKAVDVLSENKAYCSSYRDELNSPLYPFGYGLSYTTFEIGDITLDKSSMKAGESARISVEVKNTGKFDGEEVVQFYIKDEFASVVRPVKELKGFKKVFIKKGESVNVSFSVSENDLAFYNENLEFKAEKGKFVLTVSNGITEKSVDFYLK